MFPVTALLEERLQIGGDQSSWYPKLIRLVIVSITGFVVILVSWAIYSYSTYLHFNTLSSFSQVPRFADLMALVGATCCTLLGFILPGLCHLLIFGRTLTREQVFLDYALVGIGVVGAILGTFDAIVKIMG